MEINVHNLTLNELLALPIPETKEAIESLSEEELIEQYSNYREITELIDYLRRQDYSRERDLDIEKLKNKVKPFDDLWTQLNSDSPTGNQESINRPPCGPNSADLSTDLSLEKVQEIATLISKFPDAPPLKKAAYQLSIQELAQYITDSSVKLTNKPATNSNGRAEKLINLYTKVNPYGLSDRLVFKSRTLAKYLKSLNDLLKR